ncbi:type II toxin-antitoxin system mRNA interferase toxin, RelE/StbE family [Candidatus Pacearchaeota archaeon]|nr:type II toxin-antitoxin system mRNA interferase toxin, RelE/StbE family [Candidatus Pacearchaeota archaeon]
MVYLLTTINRKTEKILAEYTFIRHDIKEKLDRLKEDPRRANGAHPLHGKLHGKWSCWLGSNIRLIYTIDDNKKLIIIHAVGTHKFTNT